MGSCLKILRGVPLNSTYTDTIAPHAYYGLGGEDRTKYLDTRNAVLTYFRSLAVFSTKSTELRFRNADTISYVRESENSIRVNVKRDLLEGCNYLMFTNDLKGEIYDGVTVNADGKEVLSGADDNYFWHFAFIDSLDYISDGATRINFTIDVLQTWMPFLFVQSALVTREHVMDDTVGNNIISEPLSIGQYVSAGDDYIKVGGTDDWLGEWSAKHRFFMKLPANAVSLGRDAGLADADKYYVALVSYSQGRKFGIFEKEITGRETYSSEKNAYVWNSGAAGLFTQNSISFFNGACGCKTIGVRMNITTLNRTAGENDLLWVYNLLYKIVADLAGEIVSVTFVPLKFFNSTHRSVLIRDGWMYLDHYSGSFGSIKISRDFSALNVKNNKIFTYPFTRIVASTPSSCVIYRPEFFEKEITNEGYVNTDIVFEGTLSVDPSVSMTVMPKKYAKKTEDGKNLSEVQDWYKLNYSGNDYLVTTDFPTMQYSVDNFAYYLRDNLIGDTAKALSGVLQGGFQAYVQHWTLVKKPNEYLHKKAKFTEGIASAVGSALSYAGTMLNAAQSPAKQGGANSNTSSLVTGEIGIDVRVEIPSPSELKAIDSYFTTYGYAINQNKQPNIFELFTYTRDKTNWIKSTSIRPAFNYVECEQIVFRSKPVNDGIMLGTNNYGMFTLSNAAANNFARYMPSDDEMAAIQQIFKRGVTFWEDPYLIGEYNSVNNDIVPKEVSK